MNFEAEHLRSPHVDNQLKFRRRLDWKLTRLRTPEDPINIRRGLPKRGDDVSSVGHQAAGYDVVPERVDAGPEVFGRQCEDLVAVGPRINTREHNQASV